MSTAVFSVRSADVFKRLKSELSGKKIEYVELKIKDKLNLVFDPD